MAYNQVLPHKNFVRGPDELREEITVVLPTLNEAETIGKLIDEWGTLSGHLKRK